jgi:GT2 family glycosyltransferase
MRVSVLIATYNRPEALRATLADLGAQTRPPDEVIVVDQSQDEQGRPLDQRGQLPTLAGLRYLRHSPPNAQRARNRAIREARGDLLILVDDDVRMPPNFIANHLASYEKDPGLDGVSGQVLEPGKQPTGELPRPFHWPHNGWMFLPLHYDRACPAINWPSCNGSVRRAAALAVGGFDEQFVRTWNDDSDFSWRLHQAGCRVVFDPAATLVHLKVPSGGKRPGGRDRYVIADTEFWGTLFYFWRKNFGLRRVWRHFAFYVRGLICRKVLLVRPHLLAVAAYHCAAGYWWASRRLREGPIYLREGPLAAGQAAECDTVPTVLPAASGERA